MRVATGKLRIESNDAEEFGDSGIMLRWATAVRVDRFREGPA